MKKAIEEAKKMRDSIQDDGRTLYHRQTIYKFNELIQRLEAKEEKPTTNGWIEVSKQLPEEDLIVQVFIQKKDSIRDKTQEVAFFSAFHKCFNLNPPIY